MNIRIEPRLLGGKVSIVSSKSLSHRYVLAAGLAKGQSDIRNVLVSDDLKATRDALSAFGVRFEQSMISGGDFILKQDTIDVMESGSTLRFMIPVSMLQSKAVTFTGKGRLDQRPLDVYEDMFNKQGMTFSRPDGAWLPLTVQGPLNAGYFPIPGDISSQFVTGLLFACPLLKKDSVIELTSPLQSKGYVDLTLDVLKRFGIHILKVDPYIYIKGGQSYQPQNLTVEGDYSQAAFFFVAGTLGQTVELSDLNPLTKQGDAAIVDILRKMGADITYQTKEATYVVKPSQTKGTTIDLADVPDLGPILMVLAALSEGKTVFKQVKRLRIKESDRLEAMRCTLEKFGVNVKVFEDEAIIEGVPRLRGNQSFDSFGDHRIAMAIAIASQRADGPVTIENANVVSKSYPDFFEIFQTLGGACHET